jgi:hypothetical protein
MADVTIDKIETPISGGVYPSSRQTSPLASALLEFSVYQRFACLYTQQKKPKITKHPPH